MDGDADDLDQLDDVQRELEDLRLENRIFKSYYERHASEVVDVDEDKRKTTNRQRRRQLPTVLTIEQKVEIGVHEQEVAHKDLEDTKRNSEKLIDTLKAVLEETDIRIADLKKEAYEFKRDIVVGAENMRTGNTMAEKVIRYMEDKLRQRDAMTEKLRLKNTTLKGQLQKVEGQLRQKDDMGDALHYIDFHQLQIENKQYVSRIEERNDELLKLKMTTGKTVQALNTLKNLLHQRLAESEWLSKEIRLRTETLSKIKEENRAVATEITAERRAKKKLSQHKADTQEMPNVDDYIAQKAAVYQLQSYLANWERKVRNIDAILRSSPPFPNVWYPRVLKVLGLSTYYIDSRPGTNTA
ncbi:unnamed protein product [Ectocarpus sp. 12 AP-2014]